MNLEENQIIELEDGKDYIILKKVEYNSYDYIYLMSVEKPIKVLVAKVDNSADELSLEIVNNEEELNNIVNLFEK